jgi:hypothetical protein
MAPLPPQRLTPFVKPFLYTGVDLFGPMQVTVGRRVELRYGVLFTCLVMRAIHLELARDLSTDSFLICLRNFLNRRGKVAEIWSDNGTNFRGAARELKRSFLEVLGDPDVDGELTKHRISWHFITPGSPHHGGAWERMIAVVKKVLLMLLHARAPKPETLYSFLVEAENIINSRPLTHVAIDSQSQEALTPNHFLLGESNGMPSPCLIDKSDELSPKQWRYSQLLANHFWSRWIKEYLPDITRRTKWFKRSKPLAVGDLVFIVDGGAARNTWKRGMVSGVVMGRDGQVRSASVRMPDGKILSRPITRLAALDVA